MTRVISIANSKGGVGKSTVTILLASALAKQKNKKVLILDTDSQASVSEWLATEQQAYPEEKSLVKVEAIAPEHVQMYLEKFGEDYDIIFIDIPRMTNSMNETANVQLLYYCDSVLIPILGSRLDVMSTGKFFQVVKDAEMKKKELGFDYKIIGFLNKETNRKDNQHAKMILGQEGGIPMMKTTLRDLKLFTAPSLFDSLLDTKEGRERFEPFFNEVIEELEIK
jgi:chromosome partitioning protein